MRRDFSILLAEDDDPLRGCLTELLVDQGWQVHAAGAGNDALVLARRVQIDFSILDLHLPGMNGLEILQTLADEHRCFPAIVMSGEASAEEVRAARERGAFTFLRKPLQLDRFMTSVDDLIRAHFPPGAPFPDGDAPSIPAS